MAGRGRGDIPPQGTLKSLLHQAKKMYELVIPLKSNFAAKGSQPHMGKGGGMAGGYPHACGQTVCSHVRGF